MIFTLEQLDDANFTKLELLVKAWQKLSNESLLSSPWSGFFRDLEKTSIIRASSYAVGGKISLEDAYYSVKYLPLKEATIEDRAIARSYRDALNYTIELYKDEYFDFSVSFIRALHYIACAYQHDKEPGRWRLGHVWVSGEMSPMIYQPPTIKEIPRLMEEVILRQNSFSAASAPMKAAQAFMVHLNMLAIRPFRDGNGRISRLLHSLLLGQCSGVSPELISIEEYISKNLKSYNALLQTTFGHNYNPKGNINPWMDFCLKAHLWQINNLKQRLQQDRRAWAQAQSLVNTHGLATHSTPLLGHAFLGLKVYPANYQQLNSLTAHEIKQEIQALTNLKLLELKKSPKNDYYIATEKLKKNINRVTTGSLFDA